MSLICKMKSKLGIAGLATGLVFAGAIGASAAVIDFTADPGPDPVAGGTVLGTIGWTATFDPDDPKNDQDFDGSASPTNSFGLDFAKDGWGITDDELDGETSPPQSITITFDRAVKLVGFAFLDLFANDTPGSGGEFGTMTVGATSVNVNFDLLNDPFGGYAELMLNTPLIGSVVTFTAGNTNDNAGVADGALAALKVAPVPLPAGGLLLLTALGGVVALRRKRKAA